jgi:hypothetical protein
MGRWKIWVGALLTAGFLLSGWAGTAGLRVAYAARAPARVILRGTIAKVDPAAKTLTVKTAKGETVEVVGTDKTVLLIVGIRKPTWNDLHPDERVLVVGTRADGKVEALRIGVRPPVRSVRGVIAEIRGNQLVVDTGKGKVTLVTDERTRFRIRGLKSPSVKDLRVGDRVSAVAVGHWDDLWYANQVARIRPAR